ncbi:tRNA (cytosine(32)/uridine(32)-2'-O)-methyltransferase TrmJ [Mergibacter septicus]|uniref:tRNA (cytosine(32)/uridine(32)-2'-O)-methyltransferase TrmJ n=1 Tax=Mergibacter septicus TaxID=221402 RepID=UPI00117916F4|nr:tRNA (cytosine(32)/uridine(32)-2'-O)-methyltransferase TrmJ [Mergibacter septicus]AWX14168.1 tRNA (cytosine(32)/uridine(32)-2'-O)-methyltransferase TrmJ [Mergibacter septicus]
MLDRIKIVLIETSHTGNIGSAARAMKTMGLHHLCLVAPKMLPDQQAMALSAGATNVVEQAEIVGSFEEAIADCTLVIGTSARSRHFQTMQIEPRSCGERVVEQANIGGKVAVVFGRERVGLTNDELLKCHYHLNIPANPEYSSLNLAMAVQLVSYEIRMAWLSWQRSSQKMATITPDTIVSTEQLPPNQKELEYFFNQTEQFYTELGFIQNPVVMQKLRQLYLRQHLRKNELNILLGMLTAVKQKIR